MNAKIPKTPKKNAGLRLRELSIKRREGLRPSEELLEILRHPKNPKNKDKQVAVPRDPELVES